MFISEPLRFAPVRTLPTEIGDASRVAGPGLAGTMEQAVQIVKQQPQASSDLREARAKLAELRVNFGENHPEVQSQLKRIQELERMTRKNRMRRQMCAKPSEAGRPKNEIHGFSPDGSATISQDQGTGRKMTGNAAFVTTHWTRVLQARGDSPDAKAALSDLCAAYYNPVFAFIRSHSTDEDSARDLTQEFFARLLARQNISKVDPERGRFRCFLLGAVKHFLADMRDHSQRLKRGGGTMIESLDEGTDTSPGLQ